MKKFILLTGLLMALISCNAQNAGTPSFSNMDPAEFQKAFANEESPVLLDVRTPGEFNQGNIKGALNMDFYGANFQEQLKKLPKDKTIYVYCASGNRSAKAARMLSEMGYKTVNATAGYGQLSRFF